MNHEKFDSPEGDGRDTADALQVKMLSWLEAKRMDPEVAQRPFFEDPSIPSPVQQPLLTGAVDGIPLQTYFDRWEANKTAEAGSAVGINSSYIIGGMTGAREILIRRSPAFITGKTGDYGRRPIVPNFTTSERGSDIFRARGYREEGFEEDEEIRKALVYTGDKLYEIRGNLEALREDPGFKGSTKIGTFVAEWFLVPLEEAYRLEISGKDAPRRGSLFELANETVQRRLMLGRATILEYWGFETDEAGQVTSKESLKHPTHTEYSLYPSPKERAVFYSIARVYYPEGSGREDEVSRIEETIVVADPDRISKNQLRFRFFTSEF